MKPIAFLYVKSFNDASGRCCSASKGEIFMKLYINKIHFLVRSIFAFGVRRGFPVYGRGDNGFSFLNEYGPLK